MPADKVNVLHAHDLRDDRQASLAPHLAQDFQRFQAQALEVIGRRARLVGAAAQHHRARLFDGARRAQHLLP